MGVRDFPHSCLKRYVARTISSSRSSVPSRSRACLSADAHGDVVDCDCDCESEPTATETAEDIAVILWVVAQHASVLDQKINCITYNAEDSSLKSRSLLD